jgi:phospholipid/cholesterol/gamma-HCH transport system substrate-binding protein
MAKNRTYELGVGCLLLAALVVLAFMALEVGALTRFGDNVSVTARFTDAAGLQPGSAVSVAGVAIGSVSDLTLDPATHDAAIVAMELDPAAHVGKDAIVRVRQRSLLGEKYLELVPGNPNAPLAVDGDRLASVGEQMEIDELLAKMAPVFDGIDPALVSSVLASVSKRMQDDPELVARVLNNTDRLLASAADSSERLPALLDDGQATLAQSRAALAELDRRAKQGGDVLSHADAVLDGVQTASADLPATVTEVRALVADGREVAGLLRRDNDKLELVLDNLSGFDEVELRRLMREEGILVRIRPAEVDPDAPDTYTRRGKVKR